MNKYSTLLLASVLGALLVGCSDGGHAEEVGHTDEPEAEEQHSEDLVLSADKAAIAGIETTIARTMPLQAQLKVTGIVNTTSHGRAVVTPPVEGRITRLLVQIGDTVRVGQGVAVLQSADLAEASAGISDARRDLSAAQAAVEEASSQLDLARSKERSANSNLARQRQLAKVGAFSQAPLHEVQRQLNEAQAELEHASQEEIVHQAQLERAERLYKQDLISQSEVELARLELQQDKVRKQRASNEVTIAKAAFEREREISQKGLLTAKEVQEAEAGVRDAALEVAQSRIRLAAAKSSVQSARQSVENAGLHYAALSGGSRAGGGSVTVTSPISGVITHFEVTLGQAVERTTEICEVENLRSVVVVASVPEKQISLVRKGGRAQVTVAAHPGVVLNGVVQSVGNRLDEKSRTMPVNVLVDNSVGTLKSDMFASVALGVGSSGEALAIPRSAIVEDGDRHLLYVSEEENKYEERSVLPGRIQGELIEILEGLKAGEKVVSKGAFVLKSEKVKAELKGHGH